MRKSLKPLFALTLVLTITSFASYFNSLRAQIEYCRQIASNGNCYTIYNGSIIEGYGCYNYGITGDLYACPTWPG